MQDADKIEYVPSSLCPLQDDGRQEERHCRDLDWSLDGVAYPDPDSGIERTFGVQRCRRCAVAFTDPVPSPETSSLLYADRSSNDFQGRDTPIVDRLKRRSAARDLDTMFELAGAQHVGSMLDYGCGNAMFAVIAAERRRDLRVVATDYHVEEPPAVAESTADVSYVPYAGLDGLPAEFDVVLCRHVLEHTYDPAATLRALARLITDDGAVIIEVPRYNSPLRHVFGRFWHGYYVPFHPLHFTLEGLSNVAAAAGLDVVGHGPAEMPSIGRNFQNVTRRKYSLGLFSLGVALHPLQLLVGRLTGRSVAMRVALRKRPVA